jgi:SsrA-binding protein
MNKAERKVGFNYNILQKFTAGLHLTSEQVVAIRAGHLNIQNAFVHISKQQEAWMKNVKLYDYVHEIKLLLKKAEIKKLVGYTSIKGHVIIPIYIERIQKYYKVIIGICTPLKLIDKREKIKERTLKRQMNE